MAYSVDISGCTDFYGPGGLIDVTCRYVYSPDFLPGYVCAYGVTGQGNLHLPFYPDCTDPAIGIHPTLAGWWNADKPQTYDFLPPISQGANDSHWLALPASLAPYPNNYFAPLFENLLLHLDSAEPDLTKNPYMASWFGTDFTAYSDLEVAVVKFICIINSGTFDAVRAKNQEQLDRFRMGTSYWVKPKDYVNLTAIAAQTFGGKTFNAAVKVASAVTDWANADNTVFKTSFGHDGLGNLFAGKKQNRFFEPAPVPVSTSGNTFIYAACAFLFIYLFNNRR